MQIKDDTKEAEDALTMARLIQQKLGVRSQDNRDEIREWLDEAEFHIGRVRRDLDKIDDLDGVDPEDSVEFYK